MKKLMCILIATITLLSCGISVSAQSEYPFGYYIDKVEYIDDNVAEATIMLASEEKSELDMNFVGLLALYNGKTGEFLELSSVEYELETPFKEEHRHWIKQKITVADTTLDEYEFKFFVWKNVESMMPVGYVDLGINQYFLAQSDLHIKDTLIAEGKIPYYNLDPTDTLISVDIVKYDDAYKNNNTVSGTFTGDIHYVNKGDVDIKGLQGLMLTMRINIADPDEPILISATPKEGYNESLIIAPELFEGIDNDGTYTSRLKYKESIDSTLVTTTKINADVTVYVNLVDVEVGSLGGIASSNFLADIDPATTNINELKFVDTDNDGYYDTLYIDESASFVVGRVDADAQEIYAEASASVYTSNTKSYLSEDNLYMPLSLDTSDDDTDYDIKDINGNKLKFSDIKEGDILTVRKSDFCDCYYYDITVSKKSITGGITAVMEKTVKNCSITYYTINGTDYRINGYSSDDYKLKAGATGTFYITPDNKIIKAELPRSYKFGIAVAFAQNDTGFESEFLARIVKEDGTYEDFKLANTVNVNDSSYFNSSVISEISPGTLVMYELNQDGEIRSLYTTANAIRTRDDDLRVSTFDYAEYNAKRGKLNGKYLDNNTAIVAVKNVSDTSDVKKYFSASKDNLTDADVYSGTMIYDCNKEILLAFITNLDIKPAYDSQAMVITGTATTSVNGDKRDLLIGYMGTKEVIYTVASDVDFYDLGGTYIDYCTPRANEVIQFTLDKDGYINSVRKLVGYYNNDLCAVRIKEAYVDDDTDDEYRPNEAEIFSLKTGTAVSNATVQDFKGYGVAGKVNAIDSFEIELFKESAVSDITYNTTYRTYYKNGEEITADDLQDYRNLLSVFYEGTAYFCSPVYSKLKTGSLASVKTFEVFGCNIGKLISTDSSEKSTCEDIVYIYNCDGTNVLNYVYDPLGNSK